MSFKIVVPSCVKRAFDEGEPERRGAGEMDAELVRLAHQRAVIDRAPDHAPGLGLLRRHRLGSERKRPRAGGADQARQDPGAARIRHQPDLGEGLHEARRARGQHDIAGQRDIAAGARGNAVDGGDDRKGQRAQLAHQRIVIGLERAAQHRRLASLGEPVIEVLAGAETAAGAGKKERPAIAVALGGGERLVQRHVHGLSEGVEPGRPVQRDDAIARTGFDKDGCLIHGRSLRMRHAQPPAAATGSRGS